MKYYVRNIVQHLIKKYNTSNPYELADCLNVHIVMWDLHREILGFYKYEKRTKWIFINSNLSDIEKDITCYHELGHSVLHPRFNTPHLRRDTMFSVSKLEKEANLFTVELLLPDDLWNEYLANFNNLEAISQHTNIPIELLKLKLGF
ncbi:MULTISPECIES: ImmA/IrrE family metallo-endopeptidase [Bacillus]|uniref:ImmA/IrrE family metallo-endopeptidase n=1 Tax=Bacillus TaxID=1386 RepID=UPI00037D8DE6|nr:MULTISPECIES: ImmA/IrrE family metallo-endopeptidase [Bacillus]